MANRVEYAVSATPVRTIGVEPGQYAAQDVIEADINKTLGGDASVLTGASTITVVGFQTGTVAYGNCPASGKLALGAQAAMDMVFIKNTGNQYSSATALGAATTNDLIVQKEESDTNFVEICRIPPGGAICLPKTPGLGSNCTWAVESSGSDTIAVEYALIT